MSAAPAPQALDRGGPLARRVGLVVGAVLALGLAVAPGLDGAQRGVAAVTALCATYWLTQALPIAATSLLPAALFPLLGVMPAREIAPVYMHDLVLLFLGAFVISLGLEHWDVHRRMALAILARVGTAPRRLVLGFMLASAFLSMWISNTATTLLMLPIGLAAVECVGLEEGAERRRLTQCLLLGLAYAASMGGTATPVGTAPNQAFLGLFGERFPEAPELGFGTWLVGSHSPPGDCHRVCRAAHPGRRSGITHARADDRAHCASRCEHCHQRKCRGPVLQKPLHGRPVLSPIFRDGS